MTRSRQVAKAWASLTVVAAVSFHGRVEAQVARDPAAAGAAFARGRDALKRGDLGLACELFAESARLDPAPGALLNLGECSERRGRLATARQSFVDALETLPAGDSRIAFAQDRIASLTPRIPTLTLTLAPSVPADAIVLRDDQRVAAGSLGAEIPLDPGEHQIRLHVAGHVDATQSITLASGEHRAITLVEGAQLPVATPAPSSRAESPSPASPASSGGKTFAWGLVAGGGAALATGAVFGVLTLDRASTVKERCTPRCDDVGYAAGEEGRWMSIVSPIALGLGAVLVAAGITILVARRSEPAATKLAPFSSVLSW